MTNESPASVPARMPAITIEFLGGNCPVQGEGTVDGKPFYFRARGGSWSMSIGGEDVVGKPEWYYEQPYGVWPAAGWMTDEEADAFLRMAAAKYAAGEPGQPDNEGLPKGVVCPVSLMHPMRTAGAYAADEAFPGSPNHRAGFNAGVAWAIGQMFQRMTPSQQSAFMAEWK